MEIIPKVYDVLSTTALYLILIIFIVKYRKKKNISLETYYKELVWPLKRPAILFALLRQHYYCVGEETRGIVIASCIMALMVLTAEFCLKKKLDSQRTESKEDAQ